MHARIVLGGNDRPGLMSTARYFKRVPLRQGTARSRRSDRKRTHYQSRLSWAWLADRHPVSRPGRGSLSPNTFTMRQGTKLSQRRLVEPPKGGRSDSIRPTTVFGDPGRQSESRRLRAGRHPVLRTPKCEQICLLCSVRGRLQKDQSPNLAAS